MCKVLTWISVDLCKRCHTFKSTVLAWYQIDIVEMSSYYLLDNFLTVLKVLTSHTNGTPASVKNITND
ncbi:hypothetical protein NVIRPANT_00337 [Pantoea sp. Nvir]|nr:hypothetical protein NVIRPANT_00337 [Pantoea sp. Nvir]